MILAFTKQVYMRMNTGEDSNLRDKLLQAKVSTADPTLGRIPAYVYFWHGTGSYHLSNVD